MKRFSVAIGACLVAFLCQGAVAQQAPKPGAKEPTAMAGPQKLKVITPEFRKQILQTMQMYTQFRAQFRAVLYTDPITASCVNNKCPVQIQVIQVKDDANRTYCVGLAPEKVTFSNTKENNSAKRIVWELVPEPPIENAEIFFHGENDHGILWLSNFGSPQKQLHTGRLGDGGVGTPDRKKFHVMNRHTKEGEAVYVPIILQKETGTEKISLCGTPDPLIENTP